MSRRNHLSELNPYRAPTVDFQIPAETTKRIPTSPWQYVGRSLLATMVAGFVLPMFVTTRGLHRDFLFIDAFPAIICVWNFCRCPRRAWIQKLLLLVIMLPTLYVAVYELLDIVVPFYRSAGIGG